MESLLIVIVVVGLVVWAYFEGETQHKRVTRKRKSNRRISNQGPRTHVAYKPVSLHPKRCPNGRRQ